MCLHVLDVQIADFGMARDVTNDTGKIPVKWTAPEVTNLYIDMQLVEGIVGAFLNKFTISNMSEA